MLTFSIPMDDILYSRYLEYVTLNKSFRYEALRFENGRLVVEIDQKNMATMNGFFASLIQIARGQGRTAKDIDLMISQGDYHELVEINPMIEGCLPIHLDNLDDYTAMAECALSTTFVGNGKKESRIFLSFSFSNDIPRIYGFEARKAKKTEQLGQLPKLFYTGNPQIDENAIAKELSHSSGVTFLLRKQLLPPDVHSAISRLSERAKHIASDNHIALNSIIVTISPSFDFTAMQNGSALIINLQRISQWRLIWQDDQLLEAFLTHELLHSVNIAPTKTRGEIMHNLTSMAAAYDGIPYGSHVLPMYINQWDNMLAELAVYRATDIHKLKTYLDYYVADDLLNRIINAKRLRGKLRFQTLLMISVIDVAVHKKQIAVKGFDQLFQYVIDRGIFEAISSIVTVIWDKSDGKNPLLIDEGMLRLARALHRYYYTDSPVPF